MVIAAKLNIEEGLNQIFYNEEADSDLEDDVSEQEDDIEGKL